jgi:hypothetical protein
MLTIENASLRSLLSRVTFLTTPNRLFSATSNTRGLSCGREKTASPGALQPFELLRDCRLHLNARTHQHKGAVQAPFRSQVQHISG